MHHPVCSLPFSLPLLAANKEKLSTLNCFPLRFKKKKKKKKKKKFSFFFLLPPPQLFSCDVVLHLLSRPSSREHSRNKSKRLAFLRIRPQNCSLLSTTNSIITSFHHIFLTDSCEHVESLAPVRESRVDGTEIPQSPRPDFMPKKSVQKLLGGISGDTCWCALPVSQTNKWLERFRINKLTTTRTVGNGGFVK